MNQKIKTIKRRLKSVFGVLLFTYACILFVAIMLQSCKQESPTIILDDGYEKIKSIHTIASCLSPQGKYMTIVKSFTDGRCEFRQDFDNGDPSFHVQVDSSQIGYILDSIGHAIDTIEGAFIDVIRSHEFHRMHTMPNDYFQNIEFANESTDGQLSFKSLDRLGNPVYLLYSSDDSRINKIEMLSPIDTSQSIEIIHSDWVESDYGQLVEKLKVIQNKKDTFHFNFSTIRINNK